MVCVSVALVSAARHEKNVPAEQSASEADARIPGPDGDAGRAQRAQAAACERTAAPHGLRSAQAAGVRPGTFPKRARLRTRGDYLRVQREGERQHTEDFVVLRAAGRSADSRIGITVSARVGNAVMRNRVKRLLREVLRVWWRQIRPPADVVVIAKPCAARTSHEKAAAQLRRALGIHA